MVSQIVDNGQGWLSIGGKRGGDQLGKAYTPSLLNVTCRTKTAKVRFSAVLEPHLIHIKQKSASHKIET